MTDSGSAPPIDLGNAVEDLVPLRERELVHLGREPEDGDAVGPVRRDGLDLGAHRREIDPIVGVEERERHRVEA